MSLRFRGLKSTDVRPSTYSIDNLGPEVQAMTFTYNGVVYTINRRGKSNVKMYTSHTRRTCTVTNGTDKMANMNIFKFDFVSIVYTNGDIESNDYSSR